MIETSLAGAAADRLFPARCRPDGRADLRPPAHLLDVLEIVQRALVVVAQAARFVIDDGMKRGQAVRRSC